MRECDSIWVIDSDVERFEHQFKMAEEGVNDKESHAHRAKVKWSLSVTGNCLAYYVDLYLLCGEETT